jgi:predicted RNase H-like HicB family nuclease
MKREFNVIIERDSEGYLVASVPELHGCHTQARSLDQLLERTKEVIELCLEEYGPEDEPNEFLGIQKVAVEA